MPARRQQRIEEGERRRSRSEGVDHQRDRNAAPPRRDQPVEDELPAAVRGEDVIIELEAFLRAVDQVHQRLAQRRSRLYHAQTVAMQRQADLPLTWPLAWPRLCLLDARHAPFMPSFGAAVPSLWPFT